MITPLQPKEFFRGVWKGEGKLIVHPLLRLLVPNQQIHVTTQSIPISDTVWMVKDCFKFSSGRVIDRKMFSELVAPDRIHVTADDMPLGADMLLYKDRFCFTPYFILTDLKGGMFRLRCKDECRVDKNGHVHDEIKMYFFRFPVAKMEIDPIKIERGHPPTV